MKRSAIVVALMGLAASSLLAAGKGSVTGEYVEARTSEVFTGGCIMNSEAETMGKQAVLAWKVDRGSQVALDVSKHLVHDPSCGAMQWFHPFSSVDGAAIGMAARHSFMGASLGTKRSDPNKRFAFFGTFSY
jgi:hypothetical protein